MEVELIVGWHRRAPRRALTESAGFALGGDPMMNTYLTSFAGITAAGDIAC